VDSQWGLGLVNNLLGRIWSYKKKTNFLIFKQAEEYYEKSIINFKAVDHHRGTCVSLKDLYDVRE